MIDKTKELSIEEIFSEQSKVVFTATIEKTEDDDFVKVTPYSPDAGCQCGSSLKIPSSAIERIVSTGLMHRCCGKRLIVVEIYFKKDASIPISEVLLQKSASMLSEKYDGGHGAGVQSPFAPNVYHQPQGFPQYQAHGLSSPWYMDAGCNARPQIVCPFGYYPCKGRCGERCYNPSAGETCRDGYVCGFGYLQCGCSCYNPAAGETCHLGQVVRFPFSGC